LIVNYLNIECFYGAGYLKSKESRKGINFLNTPSYSILIDKNEF